MRCCTSSGQYDRNRTRFGRKASLLLAAAAVLVCRRESLGDFLEWNTGAGSWFTATNWTDESFPMDHVPDGSDQAEVFDGGSVGIGGGSAESEEFYVANGSNAALSSGSLTTDGEQFGISGLGLGVSGTGTFSQSGGTNQLSDLGSVYALSLAYGTASVGVYNLSGSSLLSANSSEIVGYSGVGIFNQSGGSNTITTGGSLYLGYVAGASATYVLSGGGLSVSGAEYIGDAGSGIINQSGGVNTLSTGSLVVGNSSGASGTYLMQAGNLNANGIDTNGNSEYFGYGGIAIFNQTGGTNSAAGALSVGYASGSTGTYALSGTAALAVGGSEYVGYNGTGTFNQTGGTATVGGNLQIGSQAGAVGSYSLGGTGSLTVVGNESIGGGIGTFTQTGGMQTAASLLVNSGGTFTQAGGTASFGSLSVLGGSINQTAGSIVVGSGGITIGSAVGSAAVSVLNVGQLVTSTGPLTIYTSGALYLNNANLDTGAWIIDGGLLSLGSGGVGSGLVTVENGGQIDAGGFGFGYGGGPFIVTGDGSVWYAAGITLNGASFEDESGGELSVGTLDVGNGTNGSTFTLSGGATLVATTINVTAASTFANTGGLLSVGTINEPQGQVSSDPLTLAGAGANVINYNLSGGTLSTATINVNFGGLFDMTGGALACSAFNLNGGTAIFPAVVLDSGATVPSFNLPSGAAAPQFTFTSGTLGAVNAYLGYGAGASAFTQSASVTFAPTNLYVGYNTASSCTYTLGGTAHLSASGNEYVGYSAMGAFNQSGEATNNTTYLYIGYNSGSTGTYALSGSGALSAAGYEQVGERGVGIFNQNGGTNATVNLYVGSSGGQIGNYILSLGSLTVSDSEDIGPGTFTQTGGTNTMTNPGDAADLDIGLTSPGAYVLSGSGLLSVARSEYVGDFGIGIFNQTGGTNRMSYGGQVSDLFTAYEVGSTGTYDLSGTGSILAGRNEFDGGSGVGYFYQSGGSNVITSAYTLGLAQAAGSTGTYVLSNGSLSAGTEQIGNNGAGTFMQTGGTNTFSNSFNIGASAGSTGVYSLGGGVLSGSGGIYIGGSSAGAAGSGALNVNQNGTLNASGTVTVYGAGQVNLNGGSATIGGLAIATGGFVNANSELLIVYAPGSDPISVIASYLAMGYAGGTWSGPGIDSSAVANLDATQSKLVYAVGYADGADGLTAESSGQIEIVPTIAGDASLQGTVDFGDFQVLAQYFGHSGTSWDEGDFTYSGATDFGDFQLLAQDFGANSSALTAGEVASLNSFAGQFGYTLTPNADGVGFQIVSVPEPASAGLLAAGGLGLLARRRSRR
jgi:hypothetical protein